MQPYDRGAVERLRMLARDVGPMSDEALLAVARTRWGTDQSRLREALAAALASGALVRVEGDLAAAPGTEPNPGTGAAVQTEAPTRPDGPGAAAAVVVDSAYVVRADASVPHGDRRMYHLGAVRVRPGTDVPGTGPDTFSAYVRLPDDAWSTLLRDPDTAVAHAESARPAEEVLRDFRAWLADDDVLVAYNGTVAGFAWLDAEARRAALPEFGGHRRVDALYIAHVMWPHESDFRLAALADTAGVDTDDIAPRHPLRDAVLTGRVLGKAAALVAQWPDEVRDLVFTVARASAAWDVLGALCGRTAASEPQPWDDHRVADVLHRMLAPEAAPRRTDRPPLTVPQRLWADRHISPYLLAQEILGPHKLLERRPVQEAMVTIVGGEIDGGRDTLVEAPTGTGKSLALLATALEWLSRHPHRRVVLATYTSQLQRQLARDVARLDACVPGLIATSDLVRGRAGRLSLRALTAVLADASADVAADADADPAAGPRTTGPRTTGPVNRAGRLPFTAVPEYTELLVWLLRRLVTADTAPQRWWARSVDPADASPFLAEYIAARRGRVLAVWLEAVSQNGGDYAADAPSPLARHTDTVDEALANHRVVIANHALLLCHVDSLALHGSDTLLIVDEAHAVEHAATSAAGVELDYRAVENLVAQATRWMKDRRIQPDSEVRERFADLERYLDAARLPAEAAAVFDAESGEPGRRTATLASPYDGLGKVPAARHLIRELAKLASYAARARAALARWADLHSGAMSWWEHERLRTLMARLLDVVEACERIAADAERIGNPEARPAVEPAAADDVDASSDDDVSETEEELAVADADAAANGEVNTEDRRDLPTATAANHVVHAREIDITGLAGSPRRYAFAVASHPIDLARDSGWRQARTVFARTVFVSATLRVSGSWQYIRTRLGLPEHTVVAHRLQGVFDLRRQARLVCLTDFPSWAEQSEGAMRTLAHQLAGYAREIIGRGRTAEAWRHGALVLTTSTAAAAGVAEHVGRLLPEQAPDVPVHVAPIVGNARAVAEFTDSGGICVATRGLWQGVDFPHDRLGLVWINKLPFAPFAEPVIAARRAAAAARAEAAGHPDPDRAANEDYYLPLAALDLRQAVGRLIRSAEHTGVVVISDRRLAGPGALRRTYRRIFLESLDDDLLIRDPDSGEKAGGNLLTMTEAWRRIWGFLADTGRLTPGREAVLCRPEELRRHTMIPQLRAIRDLELTPEQAAEAEKNGTLGDELVRRCGLVAGHTTFRDSPLKLYDYQQQVLRSLADHRDVLALLPTGAGKSFTFQLPALVLPGITVVVSPLVALMADQVLELNTSIGGAVRALVGPLAESNSRTGKTEVLQELRGEARHGIKIVYLSPERLADRRFADALRSAAERGTLRRIAVDEAHTFVQWGDDFRPSFRRAARLLDELRHKHDVRVTAVTATASAAVVEGIRARIFGLPERPDDSEALATVRANPLRPELAVYRRWIRKGGPVATAGLAEQVVTACEGHSIIYCLTVKEVEALHAHLRAFVGDTGSRRIRRFHGRLAEAEKASVLTEFREAPYRGEEGFVPLVVVATSAFGLGVNRKDIRMVFVASPPTDLAALYQQLGRAGRDQVPNRSAHVDTLSAVMALGTGRGLRTVAWMGAQGLPPSALRRIGNAVCEAAARDGWLDPDTMAEDCIAADVDDGVCSPAEARRDGHAEHYRTAVVGAVAALAADGVVEDGGDFPAKVRITEADGAGTPEDAVLARVCRELTGPGAAAGLVGIVATHQRLTAEVPGYRDHASDPAATWALLAALHDGGCLDVSQAGNQRTLMAVSVPAGTTAHRPVPSLPDAFLDRMTAGRARHRREFRALRDWYTATDECAVEGFARYFQAPDLPAGTCDGALRRCSTCWGRPKVPAEDTKPLLLTAFETPRPSPSVHRDTGHYQALLDKWTHALLWDCYRGLTAGMIRRVLRGEDTYIARADGRRRPLWPHLLYHRLRGVDPGARRADVEAALARMAERGLARVTSDGMWRLDGHIARDENRAAAAAGGRSR